MKIDDCVDITEGNDKITISLNGDRGIMYAGGQSKIGGLRLRDGGGAERVVIGADGDVTIEDGDGRQVLHFVAGRGTLKLGAEGRGGQLIINGDKGKTSLSLETAGQGGSLKVVDEQGDVVFHVSPSFTLIRDGLVVGSKNHVGTIGIMDVSGRPAVTVQGDCAKINLGNLGNAGDLEVLDESAKPMIQVNGQTATFKAGGTNKPGCVTLHDGEDKEVVRLSGQEAGLFLGGKHKAGEFMVLDDKGKSTFIMDGKTGTFSVGVNEMRTMINGKTGTLTVGAGPNWVLIDGEAGDIKLSGADCAEAFDLVGSTEADPGTVLVIAGENTLAPCQRPYDRLVAGVVSGANGVKPGLILNQRLDGVHRLPVALNGRVYCRVDARFAPISVGDLLTTSTTAGHAMKAKDPQRSHGAVLGKALSALDAGTGLIPVLVSLL